MNSNQIINEEQIKRLLESSKNATREEVLNIIKKAQECNGLNLQEVAILLQTKEKDLMQNLFDAARFIKDKIYGKRIVIFAPLYTSNACRNNCLYCGFRVTNKKLHRKTLNTEEIIYETQAMEKQGHKRILLVCGEDGESTNIEHVVKAVEAIYASGDIRRINVNTAPMEVEDFRRLKEVGIGTYQLFQETYHRETYKKMHPTGLKANYDYRLTALGRAVDGGIDDFGIGVLLGLYDYKFDVLATLMHAEFMEKHYKIGPHTISVPRLRPAIGAAIETAPYPVDDEDFKKIVAIYRLAAPYTGIILSTRESGILRDELLNLGVSQISAGSKTSPGGYEKEDQEATQFETSDERSLDEMLQVICKQGHLPSFCTACYRTKRTGEAFMELAKDAHIHEFCQPNAILTFKENLMDYASQETLDKGNVLIQKALEEIPNSEIRRRIEVGLQEIEGGKRDIYL